MLSAKNLCKQYKTKTALNKLNFDIEKGEIFALLGQNGAGKTTTINCFLGFIEPSSGEAFIDGINIAENSVEARKNLAYIAENVNLYPNLSGIENLAFFSSLAGFTYSKKELGTFLERAGLATSAHHQHIGNYSKGMRQKVGIAVAIAKNAKVLLLDEPTSGLDPKASNEFSTILEELRAGGTTILMATHDLFRSKQIANRIGIMKEGELVSTLDASRINANELEELYLKTI